MADLRRRAAALLADRWRPAALVLAGVVAANVLLHLLVIRELVRVSGDREVILAEERSQLGRAAAEVAGLEAAASKFACSTADVHHVFADLLSSKQHRMTAIQRELRQLARDARLDPDRLTYQFAPVRETGLVKFAITFPLDGAYDQLQRFLAQVESSPNFLIVSDIALQGERGAPGSLRLQVKLQTYFQAPDVEALRAAFPAAARTT